LIKGSKDLDLSLVSNENFRKILWPSSWALGQATWAKWPKNYFTYDITHKKSAPPNQKFFSSADYKTSRFIWALEHLSGAISGGARVLV